MVSCPTVHSGDKPVSSGSQCTYIDTVACSGESYFLQMTPHRNSNANSNLARFEELFVQQLELASSFCTIKNMYRKASSQAFTVFGSPKSAGIPRSVHIMFTVKVIHPRTTT